MSDKLPENLEDWPRDPFALFGLAHTVTQQELRRKYTSLIREYKPEQRPEQFRRIREAYETLQRYAAWNEAAGTDAMGQNSTSPNDVSAAEPGTKESEPSETSTSTPRSTQEQCWRWALSGELERAYASLCALRDQQPQDASIHLRLYWLLVAFPNLDTARSPHDWLASGLGSCSQYARLLEVYAEELADDPEEALSPRFVALLENTRGALLLELLERRWRGLAKQELWAVANNDLDVYRERVCRDDEIAWLQLLLSLASKSFHVLPLSEFSIIQKCQGQLKELSHLALNHGGFFDRFEVLVQLARESTVLAPGPVLDVAIHFVAQRMEEVETAAEPFVISVCQSPRDGLELLDRTAALAPNLLLEFWRGIDWLSWTQSDTNVPVHSPELAESALYTLLNSSIKHKSYAEARREILEYCCKEALSPEQICELLEAPSYSPNNLVRRISSDVSLRCVYAAYRLGWTKP
jgi:hypothetical protein